MKRLEYIESLTDATVCFTFNCFINNFFYLYQSRCLVKLFDITDAIM